MRNAGRLIPMLRPWLIGMKAVAIRNVVLAAGFAQKSTQPDEMSRASMLAGFTVLNLVADFFLSITTLYAGPVLR